MHPDNIWSTAGRLFRFGWFSGLVLAVASFMFLHRSQGLYHLITVCIFSGLTIIASVVWFFLLCIWLSGALPG
jgi:hypothetical protein